MNEFTIVNGRVLIGDRIEAVPLHIADGHIVGIDETGGDEIDAAGGYVLPGIVDLHGDAFERVIMPRPKVFFPIETALLETDRQLVANGITTAYYGLTVSWEPGLRSVARTREILQTLQQLRPGMTCDARLHLRWETFALDHTEAVQELLRGEGNAILAFNDHTTKDAQGRLPEHKSRQMAERAGLTSEGYNALLADVWSRRDEVERAITAMAERGRQLGAILLAHDEETLADRAFFRKLGATACEFPLALETAADARAHGEHVVLGAPNVVRGGSHNGSLDATQAIAGGNCSVLATDYYYPAPLLAAFKLVANRVCDLAAAWSLVSKHPAEVARLTDRGILSVGRRADVIIVDASTDRSPTVKQTFSAGRPVYGWQSPVRNGVL